MASSSSMFAITSCCAPRQQQQRHNVNNYGVNKSVENLLSLRNALSAINDNYRNIQQDILETFIDRGQLRQLTEPTITPTGKRIPGLKLDHPRQLALMHALVRLDHIAAGKAFTLRIVAALSCPAERYTLASLRYDLAKFRAKGLVAKLLRKLEPVPQAPDAELTLRSASSQARSSASMMSGAAATRARWASSCGASFGFGPRPDRRAVTSPVFRRRIKAFKIIGDADLKQ
jgi:hypothetical protein